MTINKEYLTITELAELLHISRVAVYKRIKKGEIKAKLIGKVYFIPREYCEEFAYKKISAKLKKEVVKGVKRVMLEYGDVLKKLGKE